MSSRRGEIRSGIVLLGLGVLVTLVSFASVDSQGSYFVATGAIVFGVLRIIRGFGARDDRVWDDQMVGREGPDDPRPQLAGSRCLGCDEKILSALEADACGACNQPVHNDCLGAHGRRAHAKPSPTPYR